MIMTSNAEPPTFDFTFSILTGMNSLTLDSMANDPSPSPSSLPSPANDKTRPILRAKKSSAKVQLRATTGDDSVFSPIFMVDGRHHGRLQMRGLIP